MKCIHKIREGKFSSFGFDLLKDIGGTEAANHVMRYHWTGIISLRLANTLESDYEKYRK